MTRVIVASKRPVWIVLTVALVIHIGLISLQGRRRIDTSFVRVWILDSLAPMEKLADRSLYGVRYVWDRYIGLIGVYDENQRLKQETGELKMQMAEQREAVLEAQRVRALVALQDSGIGKSVIARVIGRDLDLDYIDDDNDLKEGDIFLTSGLDRIYPKGLSVGRITSIGPRRGLLKTVQIRPSADLGRLEEVLCITERPQVDIVDPTQQGLPNP